MAGDKVMEKERREVVNRHSTLKVKVKKKNVTKGQIMGNR